MLTLRTLLFAIVDRLSRPQKRVALLMVDTIVAPLALLLSSAVIYNALPNLPLLARIVWLPKGFYHVDDSQIVRSFDRVGLWNLLGRLRCPGVW